MAITNFKFPGVELHQEFVQTPVTGVSTLGVAIVGPQYKLMTADVNNFDLTISGWSYSGTSKLIPKADLPGTKTPDGEVDTTLTIVGYTGTCLEVENGVFENYAAKSNTPIKATVANSVVTGGTVATIPFNTKLTTGTAATTAFGTRYPEVGDEVLLGAVRTVITDIDTEGSDTFDTIEVSTITSTTISGTTVGADITFLAKETAKVVGVTADATGLTVTGGTNTGAYIGGTAAGLKKLRDGTYNISPTFKMAGTEYQGQLGTVGSYAEIIDIFGTASVENPMALALLFALDAARENVVYFTAVKSDNQAGYREALDFLENYIDVYSIVPMTTDADIIKDCLAAVTSASENAESKVRRTLWYGIETPTGTSNAAIVNSIIDTRRDLTQSYRAQAVWADEAWYGGEAVPNYILAAAPAGMRAYEPTYRPISNLAYGFFSLKNTHGFTKKQLELLGSNGIWIIDNNYEGTPSNKKQVTTAVANNLNLDEESIVSNADSIALALCHIGEDLVGCSNISPGLITALSDTISGLMSTYTVNTTGNVYVGPQLLSWSLDAIYQHPTLRDHIYAVITCEPPKPFNRFVMTLRIV